MNHKLLALAAVAAAAGGCGGGEPEPGNDASAVERVLEREPWDSSTYAGCELVSGEEMRLALGEEITGQDEAGMYGCRWKTESFDLRLEAFGDTSLPADACAEGGQSMPYGKSAMGRQEAVEGLGDQAIWGSSGNLLVCTGRGLLSVHMERTPATMAPPEEKEVAMRLARTALNRLEPESR